MNSIGVLLLNLGTPDSPGYISVAKYLREFLSDKRVIELPAVLRWALVNLIIVPFRTSKSSAAYAKIWQAQGSPLLFHSQALKNKLAKALGKDYKVVLGMTYGCPSIKQAITELQEAHVQKIIIFPMFPQYSSAATGAPLEQALNIIAKNKLIPELVVIRDYYNNQHYIHALVASLKPYLKSKYDHILMSYHGLPERQNIGNHPYSAQCFKTSYLLAEQLNIPDNKWSVSFQSRLGKLPWIKPYTDEVLVNLRERGVKKIIICCPSFIVDCLETLEEIGIRAKEQWHELGGDDLQLVPCLNSQPEWVAGLSSIINDN